jgi:D-alanyl-D-alanine carboxypeptidase/D-alanyl-D-alanine-endopeptidase (penicillin-binding protein 4)
LNRTRTLPAKSRATINVAKDLGANRVLISGGVPAGYENWVESVAVSDAPLWFVLRLKQELEHAGIAVKGRARAVAPPDGLPGDPRRWIELGAVASPPVASIVQKMMKISQNLYAQLLLLQAGARSETPPEDFTSEELGLKRLREFAGRAGIRANELQLDDGAGLSRSGLVSPNALVQLLRFMNSHPARESFRAGLPEAGTDGTMRARLKELKGRLHAKTGTIRYVSTLAGYVVTEAGEELAFAIMLNAYAGGDREEVDGVMRLLARLSETTRN